MGQHGFLNPRRNVSLTLLAVAFMMQPTVAQAAVTVDRLQGRIGDVSAQFQLAYRLHPIEREHRQEQLAAVVAAWRAAPRSDANNEQMAAWLHTAIRSSMPGSREALPPMPKFASGDKAQTQAAGSIPAVKTSPIADEMPAADPFRDDPITNEE